MFRRRRPGRRRERPGAGGYRPTAFRPARRSCLPHRRTRFSCQGTRYRASVACLPPRALDTRAGSIAPRSIGASQRRHTTRAGKPSATLSALRSLWGRCRVPFRLRHKGSWHPTEPQEECSTKRSFVMLGRDTATTTQLEQSPSNKVTHRSSRSDWLGRPWPALPGSPAPSRGPRGQGRGAAASEAVP